MTLDQEWRTRLAVINAVNKLIVKQNRVPASAHKAASEAEARWADAVIAAFGDVELRWTLRNGGWDCRLANGERYRGDDTLQPLGEENAEPQLTIPASA